MVAVRADWHEPNEQGVSARVVGTKLDNACGDHISAHALELGYQEIVIVLDHGKVGDPFKINLATLLALAARK